MEEEEFAGEQPEASRGERSGLGAGRGRVAPAAELAVRPWEAGSLLDSGAGLKGVGDQGAVPRAVGSLF